VPDMITAAKTSINHKLQPLNALSCLTSENPNVLQEVIDGLQDGILILTETGDISHANTSGSYICRQICQANSQQNIVPSEIWNICQSLINNQDLFSDKLVILSDEIVLDKSNIFRIRVRWLDLKIDEPFYLLVTIENRYDSLRNIAIAEVKKYNMTAREAEIWLLYRCNYSYKEIATQLFITVNTVKKHMKNISSKRQA
jgi:DNA-binding CsgD family transcriptional regulator